MCWAFRVADVGVRADGGDVVAPHLGRIATAGRATPILVRREGRFRWIETRYGMTLEGERQRRNLVWNARDDRLEATETWARLVRQRFAVPIDAYAEQREAETWSVGGPAFMLGFYDLEPGGGAAAVTVSGPDGRPPALVSRADAARWLEASQWEAVPTLRRAPRIAFAPAELFEAKRLETDARSRVPLERRAA